MNNNPFHDKKVITIALAGNPNVGKSVIFNQLTGMSQVIGNWPGKTVAKAEGFCKFKGFSFKIIDLPGIYSLSTYSLEEIITREYIVENKPDYIVNVVDANQLERNLYFTLQLKQLQRPMILALNQYDLLEDRGYQINTALLQDKLDIVVQKVVAVHNRGVHELLEHIIGLEQKKSHKTQYEVTFGKEVEEQLLKIKNYLDKSNISTKYPPKFTAVKILEEDEQIIMLLNEQQNAMIKPLLFHVKEIQNNLESLHGEQISTIINGEYYQIANDLNNSVLKVQNRTHKNKFRNLIDHLTVHSIIGYLILFIVLIGIYLFIFQIGNWISGVMDGIFSAWTPSVVLFFGGDDSWLYKILWSGFMGGLVAGVGGVLPFVIPFYFVIEILQDIGYLPRAAYLMDKFMHQLGVHGKTIIPMLLGFGCTVPAISACRIMETKKQQKRSIIIASMIPCSATTTIVLGLVASHLTIWYAILLYVFLFVIILAIGRILTIFSEADESELIIELHDFRKPNFSVILKQTWNRSKEFVYMALPLMIGLGILMQILVDFQLLNTINQFMRPVTKDFLGLPIGIGVYLIYGFLRKELNLILLEIFVISQGMTMIEFMSPIQMMVFTLVTLLYIPCLATVINIRKEAGRKFTAQMVFFRLPLAIIAAGLVYWIYILVTYLIPASSFSVQICFTLVLFTFVIGDLVFIVHRFNKNRRLNHQHLITQNGINRKFGKHKFGQHKVRKQKYKEFTELTKCSGCPAFGKCTPRNKDACSED
jgi:ferrous iron transport protein B